MKIYIACDHRGVLVKSKLCEYLLDIGLDVIDIGLENNNSDDYPKFAFKLGELVTKNNSLGILICGSGVGMSIAANKVKGIRCVRALSVDDAFKGKNHNGANVIALGADITPLEDIKEIIDTFINTMNPTEERHIKRVNAINEYEGINGN